MNQLSNSLSVPFESASGKKSAHLRRIENPVRLLLGSVFLLAGTLKVAAWIMSPELLPWHDFLTSVSGLAAIIEFALAGWLVFGSDRRLAWIASAAMLLLFCGLNLYWHLIGKSSCECLGFLKIEPMWMLCIDIVLLAMTLCFVPRRPIDVLLQGLRRTLNQELVSIVVISTLLFAVFSLSVTAIFGSLSQAVAWSSGNRVLVVPRVIDVGTVTSGDKVDFQIKVKNASDNPVTLLGSTSSCTCLLTADLPITIAAGESVQIPVTLAVKGDSRFYQDICFWTEVNGVCWPVKGVVSGTAR